MKDEDWIPIVGKQGWPVITRDKHIRYKSSEASFLTKYAVGCFILVYRQNMVVQDQIILIEKVFKRIISYSTQKKPPYIFAIDRNGGFHRRK